VCDAASESGQPDDQRDDGESGDGERRPVATNPHRPSLPPSGKRSLPVRRRAWCDIGRRSSSRRRHELPVPTSDPRPIFETQDREQLYEFVDSRDGATYEEPLAADLPTDPDRYRRPVAVMKRDGLPTEVDGEFVDEVTMAVPFD